MCEIRHWSNFKTISE